MITKWRALMLAMLVSFAMAGSMPAMAQDGSGTGTGTTGSGDATTAAVDDDTDDDGMDLGWLGLLGLLGLMGLKKRDRDDNRPADIRATRT